MKAKLFGISLFAVSFSAVSPEAYSQASGDLSIEVSECVKLASDHERFACYERLAEAALEQQSSSTSASAEAAGAVSVVTGPTPTGPGAAAPVAAVSVTETLSEQPDILSTIAALDEKRRNLYTITLENGQVWQQVGSKRYPLRTGFAVRIYPSQWGNSYRLTAVDSGGFIQVERLQ
jgi:hypothetical protein